MYRYLPIVLRNLESLLRFAPESRPYVTSKLTVNDDQVVRPSLDNWNKALLQAQEAQEILVRCDCSSLDVWERTGQVGLRNLEQR